MDQADMKGDCPGVGLSHGPLTGLATSVRNADGPFWDSSWYDVVCRQCPESYSSKGFFTPAQVVGCGLRASVCPCGFASGSECAFLVEQHWLHCKASPGPSLHDLVPDRGAQVDQEQGP